MNCYKSFYWSIVNYYVLFPFTTLNKESCNLLFRHSSRNEKESGYGILFALLPTGIKKRDWLWYPVVCMRPFTPAYFYSKRRVILYSVPFKASQLNKALQQQNRKYTNAIQYQKYIFTELSKNWTYICAFHKPGVNYCCHCKLNKERETLHFPPMKVALPKRQ